MILKNYNETYAHKLRDKAYLDAYLEACLQESDEAFYLALRRAVQTRESCFTWLAAQTGLGRESLYRALSAAATRHSALSAKSSVPSAQTKPLSRTRQSRRQN